MGALDRYHVEGSSGARSYVIDRDRSDGRKVVASCWFAEDADEIARLLNERDRIHAFVKSFDLPPYAPATWVEASPEPEPETDE